MKNDDDDDDVVTYKSFNELYSVSFYVMALGEYIRGKWKIRKGNTTLLLVIASFDKEN